MPAIYQLNQGAAIDVGINLRGCDIRVPQHCLQRPQIRPARQQMRRECVPQNMRTDFRRIKPRAAGKFTNYLEQPDAADVSAA